MNAQELVDFFRSDVVDTAKPYLWTDPEVWAYANDAYQMFVRLTGGIPDSSSAVTSVDVIANQATSEVSPLILNFRTAFLASTNRKLDLINDLGEPLFSRTDYTYSYTPQDVRDLTPGNVQAMMIGLERNAKRGVVRWVRVPAVNDTVNLSVYRLPLDTVSEDRPDFEFDEIGAEHQLSLLSWMKYRAYSKQDAETFDRSKRDEYQTEFRKYCADVKAEWERYKSKVRVVEYGGL